MLFVFLLPLMLVNKDFKVDSVISKTGRNIWHPALYYVEEGKTPFIGDKVKIY